MLDWLEMLGFDFDSMDSDQSCRMCQRFWPNEKPQSICSLMVHRGYWLIVFLIGSDHSFRSYGRYH